MNPPSIRGDMIACMALHDLERLIKFLGQTPVVLASLFQQLSQADLNLKDSDEFSALENICHLRGIEIEGYGERIVRILEEDSPSLPDLALPDLDGALLAIERDYNNQDAKAALADFIDARSRNLNLLKDLGPNQVAREATLEGVGVITLEKLIELMVEHDQGHVAELQTISRRSQRRSKTSAV